MTRFTLRPTALMPLLLSAVALFVSPSAAQTSYLPGAKPPATKPPAQDTTITVEVHRLAPGVFAAKVDYVWVGWVELPDGLLLIDSGPDNRSATALADTIRARSGSKPVHYVVNTHAHGDHTGGNRLFAAAGATIIAQSKSAAKIDSTTGALKAAVRVDRRKILGPADRKVEIIWLGKSAHTAGDLVVYLPKQKVLFAGDLVSDRAIPWMLDPNFDRTGWLASLDSLRSKAFVYDKLVPGHGRMEEPVEEFRYTYGYLNAAYDKAFKMASWGTKVTAVKDWGYLGGPYEGDEFYNQVHFLNMQRLYNQARGLKTPGRPSMRAVKN